jgi:hypothetical protein
MASSGPDEPGRGGLHKSKTTLMAHWTPEYHCCVTAGVGLSIANTMEIRFRSHTMPSRTPWIRSLAYDRVTQCLEVRFHLEGGDPIPAGAVGSRSSNLETPPQ